MARTAGQSAAVMAEITISSAWNANAIIPPETCHRSRARTIQYPARAGLFTRVHTVLPSISTRTILETLPSVSRINSLLGTWTDYPGGGTGSITVAIDPAQTDVFFRLVPGP